MSQFSLYPFPSMPFSSRAPLFSLQWLCLIFLLSVSALAEEGVYFDVGITDIQENKAVFATVESLKVVPARVRIGGTIAEVLVAEGDHVKSGQLVATVGDDKLALQILALESRIQGLDAQYKQAQVDLERMDRLFKAGTVAKAILDNAQTTFDVAQTNLTAARRDRDLVRKQLSEGAVLAPVSGRVLQVPLTAGTVVMPGESLATLAEENYILRLEIPERHALYMKLGDPVRIDETELSMGVSPRGTITRIYPRIENGRVYADAMVEGLGNYFVGQRIRVWIPAGSRQGIVVPQQCVVNRSGIDWVTLLQADGSMLDVPVQVGRSVEQGLELLSGVQPGDRLKVVVQ